MTEDNKTLKMLAFEARSAYYEGKVTRDEALEKVKPYLDAVNNRAKELSKQFNVRPKKVTVHSFMR